ncbi:putative nucleoredoxin 1 isoform X1 [Apium graveolens]|uniref:putative nucleoredoxin 1 isoform X1 n=1 Tax=Apium graveolens TaxID=4045 RepID=UPI003D797D4B
MKMNCLRRLIGSRRVLWSLETTYYQKYVSTNPIHTLTTCCCAFLRSHALLTGGLANKFISNPRSICYQSEEVKGRCDEILESQEEELRIIEKGDIVNLSELLFSKNRNDLIRYNDPQLVTADQLAGKVVLMYFVPCAPYFSRKDTSMVSLIDVYNDLKPKNCFEVVFVLVDNAFSSINGGKSSHPSFFQGKTQIFEDIFSLMPWTAIPFSDINLRKYLERRFGLHRVCRSSYPIGIVVDSKGMVLNTSCANNINIYGSPAFPFSDEMLALLDSEDDIITMQPSLKSLLASPQRDYIISNTGEKVPIHTLEDKVVALFFYEDDYSYNFAEELKVAYEELARNNKKFEVVLIYLTDTYYKCECTDEEKFRATFKTMPWLALPFKDPTHKKLKRLFDHPQIVHPDLPKKAPSLVIFGPHGEFIEPCGAEVLSNFGVSGYPFTREHVVKLETKKVVELKLELLCSPTTVFERKDGSQGIIFIFQMKFLNLSRM